MGTKSPWPLLAVFSLLALRALSQDLDLADALNENTTERGGEKSATKPPGHVITTTKAAGKPKPNPASGDLDLKDALNPNNDIHFNDKNGGNGGTLTDSDLANIDDYTPDKGKDSDENHGKPKYTKKIGTVPETATIAGIASAVAMAFVGAVTSYITYQKKKLCFSIQQSLNAEVAKGENPEAVVSQEPQAQQTLLQPPNAEPPQE